MSVDRRAFFLTAGGVMMAQTVPSNQRVLGLIGAGGRGQYLMKLCMRHPEVRMGAVCDVYEPRLEQALSATGNKAKPYRNYQALLDNQEIDAVLIATPEHWHYRMLLDALAAGKDVYVEKPLCQTPEQGVELVEVASRSKSVVQVGMQRRSYDLFLKARHVVADGTLGAVRMVRSWWLNNDLQAPAGKLQGPLDWEQWLGSAPRRPLDPVRYFNWRSFADYSGGVMADQGAHVFDGIHLLMGAKYPLAVNASAGRIHRPGVDTPESVVVIAEYPEDFVACFTINYAAMHYQPRHDQLTSLDGDHARMDIGRENFLVYRKGEEEMPALSDVSGGFDKATEAHINNFLECMRTRAVPNAPVDRGFAAALVTQLGNLSLREKRRVRWNVQQNRVE
ncbi:MAG TPA: Gfo/Idh/MocA family oxidoreductase [Bryobacteraceae bacterium]|nr:Gfo/Idh/MocA family oxidoreductase [Bryobacteraceae bacterium]